MHQATDGNRWVIMIDRFIKVKAVKQRPDVTVSTNRFKGRNKWSWLNSTTLWDTCERIRLYSPKAIKMFLKIKK